MEDLGLLGWASGTEGGRRPTGVPLAQPPPCQPPLAATPTPWHTLAKKHTAVLMAQKTLRRTTATNGRCRPTRTVHAIRRTHLPRPSLHRPVLGRSRPGKTHRPARLGGSSFCSEANAPHPTRHRATGPCRSQVAQRTKPLGRVRRTGHPSIPPRARPRAAARGPHHRPHPAGAMDSSTAAGDSVVPLRQRAGTCPTWWPASANSTASTRSKD